jgi:hypothetical protein
MSKMLRLIESNPHWQADANIIDIANVLHQFASDIDRQYESGAALFRGKEKEIRPSEFTQRDKDHYGNFLLSVYDNSNPNQLTTTLLHG